MARDCDAANAPAMRHVTTVITLTRQVTFDLMSPACRANGSCVFGASAPSTFRLTVPTPTPTPTLLGNMSLQESIAFNIQDSVLRARLHPWTPPSSKRCSQHQAHCKSPSRQLPERSMRGTRVLDSWTAQDFRCHGFVGDQAVLTRLGNEKPAVSQRVSTLESPGRRPYRLLCLSSCEETLKEPSYRQTASPSHV